MPHGGKILWQAPWGKHSSPSSRLKRVAWSGHGINQTQFFPFMMIKDPFSWMNSQCRHSYDATFWFSEYDEDHCPNLIRQNNTDYDETAPVQLFKSGPKLDTLLDVWNFWYGIWEEERTTKNYPYLSIRYEDLLFHGEEVIRNACECVGGRIKDPFVYTIKSAKGSNGAHQGSNGFLNALVQYGHSVTRLNGFTDRDLNYAKKNNSTMTLMKSNDYIFPVV